MRRRIFTAALVAAALTIVAPAAAQAAPPAGLTGMALDGRVELAWQPEPGATGYRVYRGTSATTVTTPLMTSPIVPPDLSVPASFTDIGAVNGTTYYYGVRAIVGGVESANSRIVRATPRARSCSAGNPVVQENCFPGTADWNIEPVPEAVSAYATERTIDNGGSLGVKINATASTTADIEIFRSGHYGGAGARLFSTILGVPVGTQPGCSNDLALGLLDCSNWAVSQMITTTQSWPSGVYLVRVHRNDNADETQVLFVVRDDQRPAEILYGVPDTSYQAYNNFGGKSLYDDKSSGPVTVSGTTRAVKVSFDRPYQQPHDGIQHDWYTRSDFMTVRWLERSGYDVAYTGVSDLERSGASVQDHRIFISGAHDEYYSSAMRSALEAARQRGVDLFFTGANDIYWKVRFEPSPLTARQDRVMVNYKSTQSGGPDPSGIPTGTWRDPAGANAPENALEGSIYIGQEPFGYFPMRVSAAEGKDRIWRYTGLDTQANGTFTNVGTSIIGWEWDARRDNGSEPPGVVTLASSPATGDILQDAGRVYARGSAVSHMTKYSWPSGSLIVDTGTNHWNWGLALNGEGDGEPDRRIQQATTNILLDMGSAPETAAADMILDDPTAPPLITLRSPAAGANGVQPNAAVTARFSRPMDASSINDTSFTLKRTDGTAVPAVVTYDPISFTATLTPAFNLNLSTAYNVRLEGTVRAANGVALGTASTWSFTVRPPDTTPPSVSITAPAAGATVVTNATITANANDDAAVAGVQFKLDGNDLGLEDTSAPYSFAWDARGVSAGNHQITAEARDTSGNRTTSAVVNVTVDPTGLVVAMGFEETAGTTATDSSGKANTGTVNGPTRVTTGRFGRALQFDGTNDTVNIADSNTVDLTNAMTIEAWVNPSTASSWRTVLLKEQTGGMVYGLYSNTDTNRPSAHVYTTTEQDTRGTAQVAANTWTHLAATFDGATIRLYVNGTQVSTRALTGSMVTSTGALRIGGNSIWGEYFAGRIDEVRVYRRVLTASEITTDMNTSIVAPDSVAPTAPGTPTATGGIGQVQLSWAAATDDTGVVKYHVHRGASGFTASPANRIAEVTGTSYTDVGLAAGDWHYKITAEDAAGNVGPSSGQATGTATADGASPTVAISAPSAGATLTNTTNITATASDNVGVAGVQFRLDGANLGTEDTSAPYVFSWDTRTVANGNHVLSAIARDAAGNIATATNVTVNVDNPPVDVTGLVASYGFEEASGTTAIDSSGQGNAGTLAGPTRGAGRFGQALAFDGVDDIVSVADANTLDLTNAMTLEAWVNPDALADWRTVLVKEQAAGLTYGLYANGGNNRPSAHVYVGGEQDTRGTASLATGTWTHLAATYDGSNVRLYVNGTQVSSKAVSGSMATSTGVLHIGGNAFGGEFLDGLVDEVRIYRRALTAGEIQTDMSMPVVSTDGEPPSAPTGLTATGGLGRADLSWTAAADNVGVTRYNVHRSNTSGFTPSAANRIATPTGTTYADTSLSAGTWFYKVTAQDAAGNVGPASVQASAVATADTSPPTVSITSPTASAIVLGTINVTANAADNVAVASVQLKVDGNNVGSPDTSAPYSLPWDTLTTANGSHTLTVVATDGAGNATTSAQVAVTVNNPPVDTSELVGAWGFEEGTGAAAEDASTANNDGSISGASWSDSGRFGKALAFDGVDDRVNVADSATLDLSTAMTVEAWVRPAQHADWRTVVLKETTNGMEYGLYSSAWEFRPSAHISTPGEVDTRAPAALPVNNWSHLAMTYDGSTLRLYVDGTQVSSRAISGTIAASAQPLRIGGNAVWGEYFKGLIDEVRIYRRALTPAQIQSDMTAPIKPDAPPPAGPEKTGQFAQPVNWPLVPVHMAPTTTGKIMVWDGFEAAVNSERLWDPATGTFTPVPNGRNLFCSAHVTLPDGRLFVAGGHIEANLGTKDLNIFNPNDNSWFRGPDMARGRWYPTATTLPDGRVLVVSGDNITLDAPGLPVPLKNGSETLPEIYDVNTNTWTPLPAGQRRMPLYPFMFVLPDGRVVDAGPDLQTRTLNTTTGQWTNVATSTVDGHSAVMYRPGKILKTGTWADPDYPGIVSSNRAEKIDFTEAGPQWRAAAPMNHGRSYHTLTALPDGTVLASGGGSETDGIDVSKAVFPAEIWDPETDKWTEVASQQRPRLYHSSSILLPDGRVLLAGGGAFAPATNEANAEIYSPPYLFKGNRPTITSAPSVLQYGQSFTINTPDAANIQSVSLVRMGSVTHNFDMDQRFQYLNITGSTSNSVTVTAPSNNNVAPPGYYYLHVVNGNGVPSVAKMLKFNVPSADSSPPTAPPNLTAAVQTIDDVQLGWGAASDDRGVTEYRVHRSTTPGFTPTAGNRIATVTGTSYGDQNRPPGTYYYLVVAADAAGNAGPSSLEAVATILPDTTAPTVSVTAPAGGSTVSGANVSVTASANDDRGVTQVQFELDGANLGSADTGAPFSVTWNTTAASNGTHTLTAVARDAAGNSTRSANVQVTVDNGAPPTVSLTAPAAGSVSGTVAVSANAADDRGVAGVQFRVDGNNLGSADTSSPYSVNWDTLTVANGNHTLTAVATDSDGATTTSAGVVVNVQNAAQPVTGLVAAFGFEEATGTTAADSSGRGMTGTISGALHETAGRFGRALTFDGVNDWVTVADATPLDLTTGMTLEAWVRPTVVSRWRTVLIKEQAGNLTYALYANTDANRPSANFFAGVERDVLGTAQLAANTWTHLATTYDGTNLRIYVNGVLVGTRAAPGPISTSSQPLRIGGNSIWPEFFQGQIDEVRVYDRARTAAEIQTDMAQPVVPG